MKNLRMDGQRFELMTKMLTSRRSALRAGGLGLAAAATAPLARVVAQEATPAASPVSEDLSESTEFLFVQHFEGGSWMPKTGEDGAYVLTLTGAAASTTYFSDRPDRIVGIAPTQQFLDGLGFTPADPPNAALVAHTDEGDQETLLIELYNPIFDPDTQTLTYDAHILADYGEHSFVHLEQPPSDTHLPETLGDGSLFIDSCSGHDYDCYLEDLTEVGVTKVHYCWNWSAVECQPCHNPKTFCANAFSDCTNSNGDHLCGASKVGG